MFLDIDFLKNNHDMIHFFGLGFVQLKIDNNIRMHFYHPDLQPIVHDEEVHNHRYDFISSILAGKLTNELFTIQAGDSDYYMIEENCKADKIVTPERMPVILTPTSIQHFKKGDSYTCLTTQFHRVSTNFAITRLYRGQIVNDNALVIKNKKAEEICPFSKKLTEDECWEVVYNCIQISKSIF